MNEILLRAIGVVCLTACYITAAAQGINGLLFIALTNGIVAITLLSKEQVMRWLERRQNHSQANSK